MSFIADKIVMDGLTYDDVLLIPAYSEVLPRTVELSTKFSKNIELKIPFVTAAMDTVTEAKMAIAIAREGGIGVIHKNMSIKEQAKQVATVKRAENGMIYDPVTIKKGSTVRDALALMAEYKIGGIPVVDDNRYLVGIVTNRDLRFERDMNKRIDEVMTKDNLVTTNQSTDLEAAAQILQKHKIEKLPVVDKDNKLIGLVTYKDITKAKDKPMACKDSKGRLRVAAGVGVTADTMERMQALVDAGVDAIVIDTAHGHSKFVIEKLKEAKSCFPDIDIIVGNIIIDKTIITASKLCPFGKLNIFCILGTITANPNIPYNTDGIPANNSTAGDIIFANLFGATSAINTAVNIPIGTPIISAPTVATIDATTIVAIPNLSLPGNQSLPVKKSMKEYPLNINGVNPL